MARLYVLFWTSAIQRQDKGAEANLMVSFLGCLAAPHFATGSLTSVLPSSTHVLTYVYYNYLRYN